MDGAPPLVTGSCAPPPAGYSAASSGVQWWTTVPADFTPQGGERALLRRGVRDLRHHRLVGSFFHVTVCFVVKSKNLKKEKRFCWVADSNQIMQSGTGLFNKTTLTSPGRNQQSEYIESGTVALVYTGSTQSRESALPCNCTALDLLITREEQEH